MAMSVGTLAQDDVVTADKEASLPELAREMESEQVGAIVITSDDEPVGIVTDREIALSVSDDGVDLVGIVTLDDLVSILGEQLAEVADVIEAQSPAYSPGDELA